MSFFSWVFRIFFTPPTPRAPTVPSSPSSPVNGPVEQATIRLPAYTAAGEHVKLREGIKNRIYVDSLGFLTGGVGHKIVTADGKWKVGDIISDAKMSAWYSKDLSKAFTAAEAQAIELGMYTQTMLVALCAVNFQLGTGWRSKFPNTWADLKARRWQSAINRIKQSDWNKQTPVRTADFIGAIRSAYSYIA